MGQERGRRGVVGQRNRTRGPPAWRWWSRARQLFKRCVDEAGWSVRRVLGVSCGRRNAVARTLVAIA